MVAIVAAIPFDCKIIDITLHLINDLKFFKAKCSIFPDRAKWKKIRENGGLWHLCCMVCWITFNTTSTIKYSQTLCTSLSISTDAIASANAISDIRTTPHLASAEFSRLFSYKPDVSQNGQHTNCKRAISFSGVCMH